MRYIVATDGSQSSRKAADFLVQHSVSSALTHRAPCSVLIVR